MGLRKLLAHELHKLSKYFICMYALFFVDIHTLVTRAKKIQLEMYKCILWVAGNTSSM